MKKRESKVVSGLIFLKDRTTFGVERDGEVVTFNRNALHLFVKFLNNDDVLKELVDCEWLRKKYCKFCGKLFYTATDKTACCSDECRVNRERELDAKRKMASYRNKTADYHSNHLEKEIDESKRLGMSYGQYKAMKFMEEMEKIKVD